MDAIETVERESGLVIETYFDESPESPREEWDNLGKMVCFHKRYNLGDSDHDFNSGNYDGWQELAEDIEETQGPLAAILPLYLYDHSGITISTGSFSCPWDSGQAGFIFISQETMKQEGIEEKDAEKLLRSEVAVYDDYLTGQVFGYIVKDADGEELDSCWGFYGESDVMQVARESAEYEEEKMHKLATVANYCI